MRFERIKSIFHSKTFWVAFSQFLIGLGTAFEAESNEMKLVGGIAALKSLIDVMLRMYTNEPVALVHDPMDTRLIQ